MQNYECFNSDMTCSRNTWTNPSGVRFIWIRIRITLHWRVSLFMMSSIPRKKNHFIWNITNGFLVCHVRIIGNCSSIQLCGSLWKHGFLYGNVVWTDTSTMNANRRCSKPNLTGLPSWPSVVKPTIVSLSTPKINYHARGSRRIVTRTYSHLTHTDKCWRHAPLPVESTGE